MFGLELSGIQCKFYHFLLPKFNSSNLSILFANGMQNLVLCSSNIIIQTIRNYTSYCLKPCA